MSNKGCDDGDDDERRKKKTTTKEEKMKKTRAFFKTPYAPAFDFEEPMKEENYTR